ncbi:Uncharacterised protein [Cedecea davisae]|jgi:hypothetical protein|uniref:Prophage protein n=1 Tax=Cedecea davisae DSM 4568 TaxID=566551 RepID=S3J627_9ENTR|nr:hypothetical protein [Cedecea davisae]EPF20101.1 hypothetical protein HMPREF0201_00701 [Cedecea davisae DSM 4568]SUX36271.1 Uncharacterised protein [Cedecea davisae]
MKTMNLCDAVCQIEQAQIVLEMWLESTTKDADPDIPRLIGAVMTLLNGVSESVSKADTELGDYVMREHKAGKR